MYIVRKQDLDPAGGASYMIEASKRYETKYRWEKTRRSRAATFVKKCSAQLWANRYEYAVVVKV
jgi:hypothetical protein